MALISFELTLGKAPDARLIVGFDGKLATVDHGITRRPSGLDLIALPRPIFRASGFRDVEG